MNRVRTYSVEVDYVDPADGVPSRGELLVDAPTADRALAIADRIIRERWGLTPEDVESTFAWRIA